MKNFLFADILVDILFLICAIIILAVTIFSGRVVLTVLCVIACIDWVVLTAKAIIKYMDWKNKK